MTTCRELLSTIKLTRVLLISVCAIPFYMVALVWINLSAQVG